MEYLRSWCRLWGCRVVWRGLRLDVFDAMRRALVLRASEQRPIAASDERPQDGGGLGACSVRRSSAIFALACVSLA
jgi:hypothetical protein